LQNLKLGVAADKIILGKTTLV